MAKLLFIDSFDHYSLAQGSRKWTTFSGFALIAARTGLGLQSTGAELAKTFNATYYTMTLGIALNRSFYSEAVGFRNVSPATELWMDSIADGRLYLQWSLHDAPTVVSPYTTVTVNTGQWYYFELQATVTPGPPAAINATLRLNGVEVLAWSYTHTGGAASVVGAPFNALRISNFDGVMDDLYVTDTEYLGDVKIGVLYPNAAGDSAAWTPNAGTNWSQVEEHPADDDTSYVSAASTGLKDLYNLDDIDPAFTGVIKGVQALWCVKKSDEGVGAVKGLWKSGGTEITQADGHNYLAPGGYYPSAVSYLYDIQTERVSLFTAVDWTKTEINALQLGITRTV